MYPCILYTYTYKGPHRVIHAYQCSYVYIDLYTHSNMKKEKYDRYVYTYLPTNLHIHVHTSKVEV